MPRNRDPFPFPRYENDHSFTGMREDQKPPYKKPTHLAQNDEPWSSLSYKATLSSMKRSASYQDDEAPKDSLDLHLNSVYDNHLGFLQNKNQTLLQKETLLDSRRQQSKEKEENVKCDVPTMEMRVWINPKKVSIHSIEGAIESHHNASTNRGYSRKHDGGFYSI